MSDLVKAAAPVETSVEFKSVPVASTAEPAYGLRDILRVLSRRRSWIVGSTIVGCLSAIVMTVLMRPVYQASATVELNERNSGSLDLSLGDNAAPQLVGDNDLQTTLQTETSILEGDSLALSVMERLNLAQQSPFAEAIRKDTEPGLPLEQAPNRRTRLLSRFHQQLKVSVVRGTRLIKVTFESHSPKQAADISNALIDSYKSQYLQSHYAATSEASAWLTQQLSDLKKNVEESEKRLTDFEKATGILGVQSLGEGGDGTGAVHSTVVQRLDMLNNELTAAEAARIEKEAIFKLVTSGSDELILGLSQDPMALESQSLVLTQGGGLARLEQLRDQSNRLQVALAEAAATYGVNNRHMQDLETQVHALADAIRDEKREIVRRAEGDYLLAKRTEEMLRQHFDQQQGEASKLNEKTVEFAVLSQEAASRKKLYEDLYSKLQEANVSAGIKATNITVVDPARTQSIPVRPKPLVNLGIGMAAGLVLGLVLAFAIDSLDRTIVSPIEIEEITSMPVIGTIPTFGHEGKRYGYGYRLRGAYGALSRRELSNADEADKEVGSSIWILQHPESAAAEAIRSLRTSIILSRPEGGPRVILITSCVPREGKSTTSANLAASFAQHGKKVVIIEADMRRPTMQHVLNVANGAGLSDVLAGSRSFDEAVLRGVSVPTLDVLPAGPRPPLPSELLGSAGFDKLIALLRATYDIVLIDSPPALLLTDAVAIAPKADAVVWIALAGVVTRPQLSRVARMVQLNSVPMIGFVLNRVDLVQDAYGYGYGYDYGSYGSYFREEDVHEV